MRSPIGRVWIAALALLAAAAVAASAVEMTFTFVPEPGTEDEITSVSVRGSFNDWGETAMTRADDGSWSVAVDLEDGEHQYKYFVNGQWPDNMETWLSGGPADAEADGYIDDGYGGQNAVRVAGGAGGEEEEYGEAPPLPDGFARVHYHRPRGGYAGWGLHVWGDTEESVEWTSPLGPTGRDDFGLYWDVRLADGAERVGFIVHRGDTKDPGADMFLVVDEHGREVWIVSESPVIETSPPDVAALALGNLSHLRAHWVDRRTFAWRVPRAEGDVFHLHFAPEGGLTLAVDGVHGGESYVLTPDPEGLSREAANRFPHLANARALRLSEADAARAPQLLKGQVAVSVSDAEGSLKNATGVQIPGVLDDIFFYEGPLGVTWGTTGAPTISVWAPTAKSVKLHLFESSDAPEAFAVLDMSEDAGVWSIVGEPGWKWQYYLYEVEVYTPLSGTVQRNVVTDPYSRSLSMNSTRTQIVDMNDPAIATSDWANAEKPPLEAPEDIVLYELHVRDFSAADPRMTGDFDGTYLAFTAFGSGMKHLKALANAGLTHVHLLPAFDIATVNEDRSAWRDPGDLSRYAPDSSEQQAAIGEIKDLDGYNWGYDPYHYGVPEGSYASKPDGGDRIIEFRRMVAALSHMGLRVVMDVVYNHTNAAGLGEKAVLDRIVPGYYHRLNAQGLVETSTCCPNTASEHLMMERLIVDDVVHWAKDYKIDGFRFDLMGHHMKRNMEKVRDALDALTEQKDGVDGSAIYVYGEGWDFGEVQGGKRGTNATQRNMAGTGIGTFNDRIRDAVRGGSAFSDRREQGFVTGLFTDPSGHGGGGAGQRGRLLELADKIRVGMAGNLRGFSFIDHTGRVVRGGDLDYGGYTADPQEAINYVSAHDNETFFDKIQYAAAQDATLGDRVRMQNLGMSIVGLGEGIPFFHAGVDMLRSKSMDADSYNSGDWFNRLDFTYETNNFGVGLPPAEKNRDRWSIIGPLLAREDLRPGRAEIEAAVRHFREILAIRRSSPLFRLRTAEEIQARVRFHNTGPGQIPGVIAMSVSDEVEGLPDLDTDVEHIVVLVNATKESQTVRDERWGTLAFELHPILTESADEVVRGSTFDSVEGGFTVPPRTAAVFVAR